MKKKPQGDRGRSDAHSCMQFVRVCVEVISLHPGSARCTCGTFSLTKEITPLFFPVMVLQLSHTRARQLFHPTSMEEKVSSIRWKMFSPVAYSLHVGLAASLVVISPFWSMYQTTIGKNFSPPSWLPSVPMMKGPLLIEEATVSTSWAQHLRIAVVFVWQHP